jgi:hypothetical protein
MARTPFRRREIQFFQKILSMARANDRKKIAVKTAEDDALSAEQLGWRFAFGTALIVGGYIAWPLIPVVIASDLPAGLKGFLAALFGATPFLTKVAAIALMGKPAYQFLKKTVFKRFRKQGSTAK